jgi:hypothetical protein
MADKDSGGVDYSCGHDRTVAAARAMVLAPAYKGLQRLLEAMDNTGITDDELSKLVVLYRPILANPKSLGLPLGDLIKFDVGRYGAGDGGFDFDAFLRRMAMTHGTRNHYDTCHNVYRDGAKESVSDGLPEPSASDGEDDYSKRLFPISTAVSSSGAVQTLRKRPGMEEVSVMKYVWEAFFADEGATEFIVRGKPEDRKNQQYIEHGRLGEFRKYLKGVTQHAYELAISSGNVDVSAADPPGKPHMHVVDVYREGGFTPREGRAISAYMDEMDDSSALAVLLIDPPGARQFMRMDFERVRDEMDKIVLKRLAIKKKR